ncbi:unnamed protein product [Cyprideis torosa]|uniref:Uncharacterized protein n=1 Tax=Cyprideis torosa TaxID=163714 RepID=A0A7R8ZSV4_9CRUS|nr:unnamed protein product [Cyprideis torosa]CAG0896462.1 unnamed protein product [Cyprideis torosa]
MLELEVVPGRSLGCDRWELILGMHLSQAIALLQQEVEQIKEVEVSYSESNPLESDLLLCLTQDGIKLHFDALKQRLKIIEIFNLKKLQLRYCDTVFNDCDVAPNIEMIDHAFGPTHPGVYDAERQLFTLSFRGLCFYFPVDAKYQPQYAHGLGSFQFPNGASPNVVKLFIFSGSGSNLNQAEVPDIPLCCFTSAPILDKCVVDRDQDSTRGVDLDLLVEDLSSPLLQRTAIKTIHVRLEFGDHCQSVLSKLGAPSKVFYKHEDKMRIHSIPNCNSTTSAGHLRSSGGSVTTPVAGSSQQQHQSDYFFNYFTLGIDLLFDAVTNRAKKFVLHTNFPGHYDFNVYNRCDFHLHLIPTGTEFSRDRGSGGRGTSVSRSPSLLEVTALTKWENLSECIKASSRPVVLNRANSSSAGNPFGSTFCYGYQDLIFEIMPNGHIASLTIYQQ